MDASSLTAAAATPNAFRRGTVFCLRGWQWLLFWPAAAGLNLYYRTLRISIRPEERKAFDAIKGPRLLMVWHNRSLSFPAVWRFLCRETVTCLISASKMAAWEAAYFEHRGMQSIRGSSSRRSIQATREMLRTVRDGGHLGIAPDGPSGPLYDVKRGTVMIARQCNAPIVLLTANTRQAWRLKTWDRHIVPWPFARIEVRIKVIPPLRESSSMNDEELAAYLREAALSISDS